MFETFVKFVVFRLVFRCYRNFLYTNRIAVIMYVVMYSASISQFLRWSNFFKQNLIWTYNNRKSRYGRYIMFPYFGSEKHLKKWFIWFRKKARNRLNTYFRKKTRRICNVRLQIKFQPCASTYLTSMTTKWGRDKWRPENHLRFENN